VFARHANTAFGGGIASIAVLRHHLVDRHAWLYPAELDLGYALSRLTPGTNLLAFCGPALAVILLVGSLGKRAQHPRVRSMLQCVVIASAALLVLATVPIGREALDSPRSRPRDPACRWPP
jgi:chromate transport protein ChrA